MTSLLRWLRRTAIEEVEPQEAWERHRAGALLIDVREPDEWAGGHAPGASNVPLGEVARHLRGLARDCDLLLICRSGRRSRTATEQARRLGIGRAVNVRGGMIAWARAGLPVEVAAP